MNGLTMVVVLFLLGMAAIGYSKGLLHTIYSVVAGILILVLVTVATPVVAGALADYTTLDTKIEAMCHEQLRNIVNKTEIENADAQQSEGKAQTQTDKKASKKSEKKTDKKTSKRSEEKTDKKADKKTSKTTKAKADKKIGKESDQQEKIEAELAAGTINTAELIENIRDMEFQLPEAVKEYLLNTDEYADGLLEKSGVYEEISKRITKMALNAIAFVITFLILSIVFGVISQVFHIIEKLPVIEEANKGLGAVLGFAKGLVLVWLGFAFVALNAMSDFGQQFIAMVYESPLLIYIYENNFVLTLLMSLFEKI